jgi:hypothetical protein
MNQNDKRLDKVKGSLAVKEAVILWMEEAHGYRNIFEYVKYRRAQPWESAPVCRLSKQFELATRESMKGQPRERVESVVRQRQRDVVFLVHLHHQVNGDCLTEQKARHIMTGFLGERLVRLVLDDTIHEHESRSRKRQSNRPRTRRSKDDVELIQDWKEAAGMFLSELYAFQDACHSIEQHYFDGHKVLFPDTEDDLLNLIKRVEWLVESFNDLIACGSSKWTIETDQVRQAASSQASQKAAYLVDMAKAEALDQLGDPKAAAELVGRWV